MLVGKYLNNYSFTIKTIASTIFTIIFSTFIMHTIEFLKRICNKNSDKIKKLFVIEGE